MKLTDLLLQVHLVIVVIISTTLLGSGLNSASIKVIGLVAAIASFVFTERLGWIRINRVLANLGAIGVAAYAISRFFGDELGSDAKLAAIASLLTYVQAILLFQQKNSRLYWNIWVLSLLQVVVAGALKIEFEVGLLFFAFIIVSVSTMCLMTLSVDHSDTQERSERALERMARSERSAKPTPLPRSTNAITRFSRFNAQSPTATSHNNQSARSMCSLVVIGLLGGSVTVLFAFSLFYSIPRHDDIWYGPTFDRRSITGFATKISFDHGSVIRSSDRRVMRVCFTVEAEQTSKIAPDGETRAKDFVPRRKKLGKLSVDPYFTGVILSRFEQENGFWQFLSIDDPLLRTARPLKEPEENLTGELGEVRFAHQETRVDSSEIVNLFCVTPAYRVTNSKFDKSLSANSPPPGRNTHHRVVKGKESESIFKNVSGQNLSDLEFNFETVTPLYYGDRQLPVVPCTIGGHLGITGFAPPEKSFPTIYKAAREVQERYPSSDRRQLATEMNNYFLKRKFSYTLDYSQVKFDSTLHPIEDFMRNRKAGHCEYYASSLALMLRAAGIPARVVSGYRGVDFNEQTKEYTVMDRDAHTWVEAWLAPRHCNEKMFGTGQADRQLGGWLRLDPTPSDDVGTNRDYFANSLLDRITDLFGFAQSFWEDNVIGIDSKTQKESGLGPQGDGLLEGMIDGVEVKDSVQGHLADFRKGRFRASHLIVFFVIAGFLILLLVRQLVSERKKRRDGAGHRGFISHVLNRISPRLETILFGAYREPNTVDFYQRFLQIMQSVGLRPGSGQTSLEFARSAMTRIENDGVLAVSEKSGVDADNVDADNALETGEPVRMHSTSSIAGICEKIVDEFYQVRFGNRVLDEKRRSEINAVLDSLEEQFEGAKVQI